MIPYAFNIFGYPVYFTFTFNLFLSFFLLNQAIRETWLALDTLVIVFEPSLWLFFLLIYGSWQMIKAICVQSPRSYFPFYILWLTGKVRNEKFKQTVANEIILNLPLWRESSTLHYQTEKIMPQMSKFWHCESFYPIMVLTFFLIAGTKISLCCILSLKKCIA